MLSSEVVKTLRKKYRTLEPEFNERTQRLWAANEAIHLGHGGVVAVSRATGLSENTIRSARSELKADKRKHRKNRGLQGRVRREGGGRKSIVKHDPKLPSELEKLVEPTTRGDPMSPLRWTCKSSRKLADELLEQGHRVSHTKVSQLLKELGYSLQGTRKTKEGGDHPDRDAQFNYINQQVNLFQERRQPVVSVDTKKKELVGDFSNGGKEYQPKGKPEQVRVYDFVDKQLGKAIPYGVYDLTKNQGWVSVGTDHDTAQFSVATLRRWWSQMGSQVYPDAKELLITADGGGSNGSRTWLWKLELQKLADEIGLEITVCHFPPGTSKWNKIEHRMFSHITENWRGRPLVSHEVIVNLIANTRTKAGLSIQAELDKSKYPTGIKVSRKEKKEIQLEPADFHGADWNYKIKPRNNN